MGTPETQEQTCFFCNAKAESTEAAIEQGWISYAFDYNKVAEVGPICPEDMKRQNITLNTTTNDYEIPA